MKKTLALLAATTALTACNFEKKAEQPAMTEEQVRLIIDNYIEENPGKILQEVNNYMEKMQAQQAQQEMNARFDNPVEFTLDKATPVKGAEDAVITIVEFSDFECPFCQRVSPTMDALVERYQGKVKVAYKHLPLDFHANAKPAALASIAAHEQGKFWEFHDKLFANMQDLNEETFLAIAKELNLDMDKFKSDMASEKAATKLEFDMKQAAELGISGTPHFLINGVPVSGALPESEFVKVIEKLLDNQNK
jgi:protein-disulfide isomerase